jgi:hypothetical protein
VIKDSVEKRVHKVSKIIAIMSKRIDEKLYTITNYIFKDITFEQIDKLLNGKDTECKGTPIAGQPQTPGKSLNG